MQKLLQTKCAAKTGLLEPLLLDLVIATTISTLRKQKSQGFPAGFCCVDNQQYLRFRLQKSLQQGNAAAQPVKMQNCSRAAVGTLVAQIDAHIPAHHSFQLPASVGDDWSGREGRSKELRVRRSPLPALPTGFRRPWRCAEGRPLGSES